MSKVASFSLTGQNASFVSQQAQQSQASKSGIVNQALDLYRKYKLKKDMMEGLSAPLTAEDRLWVDGGLDSYRTLIDQE